MTNRPFNSSSGAVSSDTRKQSKRFKGILEPKGRVKGFRVEIRPSNSKSKIWVGTFDTRDKAMRAYDAALYYIGKDPHYYSYPKGYFRKCSQKPSKEVVVSEAKRFAEKTDFLLKNMSDLEIVDEVLNELPARAVLFDAPSQDLQVAEPLLWPELPNALPLKASSDDLQADDPFWSELHNEWLHFDVLPHDPRLDETLWPELPNVSPLKAPSQDSRLDETLWSELPNEPPLEAPSHDFQVCEELLLGLNNALRKPPNESPDLPNELPLVASSHGIQVEEALLVDLIEKTSSEALSYARPKCQEPYDWLCY
jgi:hypothetical protein